MSQGWECPKCGAVWGPFYPCCTDCSPKYCLKIQTAGTTGQQAEIVIEQGNRTQPKPYEPPTEEV